VKTRITVLAFVLLSINNLACSRTNVAKTGALLWKISGKDLDKPSYILGTFHLKPAEFLDSIPGARVALLSAEQVVGEITMNDMSHSQATKMPSDTTYQMLYSEEDYHFVNEQLTASLGTGLDKFGKWMPAEIKIMYVMTTYQKYLPDVNFANVIDIAVQNMATENNKPVLGLETVDDQISALFGSPLKRQAESLLCLLKNQDAIIAQAKSLIEAYNHFDLNRIDELVMADDDPCQISREEMDRLNKNRNNNWMKILPGMMKEKSSFIAVGAAHLAGEEGLLNQLERLGYQVEPVGREN